MSLYNHALYQIATKALIFDGDKVLVLHTPDNYLDFPGGRVDETERNLPWQEALRREIAEEIGPAVQVDIGQTLFVSKRQYSWEEKTHYIAAIFFKCRYLGGDIELSEEHGKFEWMTMPQLLNYSGKFISQDEKLQLQSLYGNEQ